LDNNRVLNILLTIKEARLPVFYQLLAAGFQVRAPVGCGVRDLLQQGLGLDAAYVEDKIQTVFLNGRAVDDFDRTEVPDGAVLALSSAMPGLVGAVFRRQSPLAGMRGVSVAAGACSSIGSRPEGWITLKLFNRVAGDLGPDFLAAGIRLPAGRLAGFLAAHPGLVFETVRIAGEVRPASELPGVLAEGEAGVQLAVQPT